MPQVIVDARVLAIACPTCGRPPRVRCAGPLGQRTSTHTTRIAAAYTNGSTP